jgi:hypothetical protein
VVGCVVSVGVGGAWRIVQCSIDFVNGEGAPLASVAPCEPLTSATLARQATMHNVCIVDGALDAVRDACYVVHSLAMVLGER